MMDFAFLERDNNGHIIYETMIDYGHFLFTRGFGLLTPEEDLADDFGDEDVDDRWLLDVTIPTKLLGNEGTFLADNREDFIRHFLGKDATEKYYLLLALNHIRETLSPVGSILRGSPVKDLPDFAYDQRLPELEPFDLDDIDRQGQKNCPERAQTYFGDAIALAQTYLRCEGLLMEDSDINGHVGTATLQAIAQWEQLFPGKSFYQSAPRWVRKIERMWPARPKFPPA